VIDEIPEGIGYFDFEIEIEPGFVTIKPCGLIKLLEQTGELRIEAEQAEEAGILLIRSSAMAMTLQAMDEEDTNEEEEPPLGDDPQKK